MNIETKNELRRGICEAMPMMFGIIPFGMILGAQAAQKGMTMVEVPLMMGLNFAGGSEFAAVGLWANPLPMLLIWTMTLMINSRHILMGAAFVPHLRDLPLRKILPTLFFMTDESWAMVLADAQRRAIFSLPYYFGVAWTLYFIWITCGFLGAIIGPILGDVEKFGFGMAFPAVFLVLIRGMWRGFRVAHPWLVSLIVAAAVYLLLPQSGWYVIGGTLAGLTYSYFLGDKHD